MASVAALKRLIKGRVKVTAAGCWEWQGARNGNGYGQCRVGPKVWTVHRLAFTLWRGPIGRGLFVRHKKCNNPPCCNPRHLLTGWHEDNTNDIVLHKTRRRTFAEPEIHGMISSFDSGESVIAIATRLHTDSRMVKAHLLRAGRKMRHHGRPKGSKNVMVRITDEMKEAIRAKYATRKFTQEELAQRFGCDQGYVSMIVRQPER